MTKVLGEHGSDCFSWSLEGFVTFFSEEATVKGQLEEQLRSLSLRTENPPAKKEKELLLEQSKRAKDCSLAAR